MTDQPDRTYPPQSPLAAGLAGACPRCGQGRLYAGLLAVAPRCAACGLDYSFADSGDGPAVFVILILGFLVLGLGLLVESAFAPPIWVHIVLWIPLTIGAAIWALRFGKAFMIALQFRHDAGQGETAE
jgi:uncharacterized protein (DUF983 family)